MNQAVRHGQPLVRRIILPEAFSIGSISVSQTQSLIAIVGPTAAGKSALGLHLARRFDGEIISGDSRQVYRQMDIGTAKPSAHDRESLPHHLFDLREPDQGFSLADFLDLAKAAIQGVHRRGRLPVLVGGSGQYVWALLEGWKTPRVPPDPELRSRLEEEARSQGPEALHDRLARVDPVAAARIDARNVRRVIRALEVARGLDGAAPAAQQPQPPYQSLVLGLRPPARAELYLRIDRRVDEMMATGWLQEVETLLACGFTPELPALSSMGYRDLARHLGGELDLDEAVRRIKTAHHLLARRQHTWFKPEDPRIRWLPADDRAFQQAETEVERFIAQPENAEGGTQQREDG
jgi:tRNA dimethylallyltransferase